MLSDEKARRIVERLCFELTDLFGGSPASLASALKGCPYSLLYVVLWNMRLLGFEEGREDGLPFSGWREFGDVILAAADEFPEIMLPQIVLFVVRRADVNEMGRLGVRYVFDSEVAKTLFDYGRLIRLFAFKGMPDVAPEEVRPSYQAACVFASSELAHLLPQ